MGDQLIWASKYESMLVSDAIKEVTDIAMQFEINTKEKFEKIRRLVILTDQLSAMGFIRNK